MSRKHPQGQPRHQLSAHQPLSPLERHPGLGRLLPYFKPWSFGLLTL